MLASLEINGVSLFQRRGTLLDCPAMWAWKVENRPPENSCKVATGHKSNFLGSISLDF